MARIGAEVTDFEGEEFHEGQVKNIKLSDYRGKWLCLVFFVMDPDRILRTIEIHDLPNAAQFVASHGDQVCPANWEPGADTRKPGMDLMGKI